MAATSSYAKRKMSVTLDSEGYLEVLACKGEVRGSVRRMESGRWVWNIWETPTSQRSIKHGGADTQYAAYGELLCEIFNLTT